MEVQEEVGRTVDAAEVKLLAQLGVDEPVGLDPEALAELGAPGVGLIGHLDHGIPHGELRPWRNVGLAEVEISDIPGLIVGKFVIG